MRRTPLSDHPGEPLDDDAQPASKVGAADAVAPDAPADAEASHPSIDAEAPPPIDVEAPPPPAETEGPDAPEVQGNPRYWRGSRWYTERAARRTDPRDPVAPLPWLLRGVLGVAALAGLWLLLQQLFPPGEDLAPATTPAAERRAESPAGPPAATAAPTAPATSAAAQERPTPPAAPTAEPTRDQDPTVSPPGAPVEAPAPATAAPEPTAAPTPEPAPTAAPTPEPTPTAPAAPPAAKPEPPPTPESPPAQEPPAAQSSEAPPPPPPPTTRPIGSPLAVEAGVSPENPTPSNQFVTVSVLVTAGEEPVGGAACRAVAAFRTETLQVPAGGFTTGPDGKGAFDVSSRNATINFPVTVRVTCSARGDTATAETTFTPRSR